jgi:hypothetical protein
MNATLERSQGKITMKRASITLAILATALTGCESAVPAVCQIGSSFTGGYGVHLTRTGTPTVGCDTPTGTPADIGDLWVFDPYAGAQGTLIIGYSTNIGGPMTGVPDPPDPNSPLYGKAYFTSLYPDGDDNCTIDSMNMSNGTDSYAITQMVWLNTAKYLGAEFKANVNVTRGGCTATYTAQAMWPPVACAENAECDPFAQPVGSGINPEFNQSCTQDPWAKDVAVIINDIFHGEDPNPDLGLCFFNAEYPSLGGFAQ